MYKESINAVKNVYETVTPPPDDRDGLFGGIFENIELVVGAVLVITLINSMKN